MNTRVQIGVVGIYILLALTGSPVAASATSQSKNPPPPTVDASETHDGFGIAASTAESASNPEPQTQDATASTPAPAGCDLTTEFGTDCTVQTNCYRSPDSPTGWASTTTKAPTIPGVAGEVVLGVCNGPDAPVVDPLPGAVRRAFAQVPVPAAVLSIQPPKGKTLVGLETIFSTTAQPFTRTLTLLRRRIQLRITPSSFTWVHGDGTTQTSDWAGRPWDGDGDMDRYLTHTYEHTGALHPSVTITWTATWRIGTGSWRAVDGTVTKAGVRADLAIVEAEPELVAP